MKVGKAESHKIKLSNIIDPADETDAVRQQRGGDPRLRRDPPDALRGREALSGQPAAQSAGAIPWI